MIGYLIKHSYGFIYTQLYVVTMVWASVFMAILIDLYFGIKKSKQLGECTTSEGLRRTISKFVYYYAMLSFALLGDFLDVFTPSFLPFPLCDAPVFSIVCAIGLILTEAKSVREKAEDKVRRKIDKSFQQVIDLLESKGGKLDEIVNKINEMNNEKK